MGHLSARSRIKAGPAAKFDHARDYNQGGACLHHGKFTTAREAVEAHNGEALSSRRTFDALTF